MGGDARERSVSWGIRKKKDRISKYSMEGSTGKKRGGDFIRGRAEEGGVERWPTVRPEKKETGERLRNLSSKPRDELGSMRHTKGGEGEHRQNYNIRIGTGGGKQASNC